MNKKTLAKVVLGIWIFIIIVFLIFALVKSPEAVLFAGLGIAGFLFMLFAPFWAIGKIWFDE